MRYRRIFWRTDAAYFWDGGQVIHRHSTAAAGYVNISGRMTIALPATMNRDPSVEQMAQWLDTWESRRLHSRAG